MDLTGAKIIVTGAASGIGLALVRALSAAVGATGAILACDIDGARLSSALADLDPARVIPIVMDVADPAGIDTLIDRARERLGAIDLFFANAGFAYYEALDHADWGRIERLFRLDVFSPVYAAVRLRETAPGQPPRVVVTASAMALMAYPGYALYGGAKAALHRFAEGYRFELRDRAAFTLVYPIGTRTGFFARAGAQTPIPFPTQAPEQVARAVVRGVQRDRATIFPSRVFAAVMLLDRVLPPMRWLIQAIAYRQFAAWRRAAQPAPTTTPRSG